MPTRVDAVLVREGLARSRRHAAELIAAGRVSVDGRPVDRPAVAVPDGSLPVVAGSAGREDDYASRGAHKLIGALDAFPAVRVDGRACLDAGASTGGFTDVLLRRGARVVVAADVGHDQLVERIRTDPRVVVREGVNARHLAAGDVQPVPELVVADLSFISLTLVLPALVAVAVPGADLLLLVKPQFEVGRERLGSGGVVRSAALREESVLTVADAATHLGCRVEGVARSPLPGPSGNVEYFLWLRAPGRDDVGPTGDAAPTGEDEQRVRTMVRDAVTGGGPNG